MLKDGLRRIDLFGALAQGGILAVPHPLLPYLSQATWIDGQPKAFMRKALEGVGEIIACQIVGGDRVAVGPFRIGPQVEGVDEPVGRDLPALGDAGLEAGAVGGEGDEPLEQGDHQVVFGRAGDGLRVKVLRLGAVADAQDLFPRGLARGAGGGRAGLRPRASGGEQAGQARNQGDEATETWRHGGEKEGAR